ncbi:MAG TPA: 3'-5' exonuclease, partial [Verrucomicrobiota bacterium]|nr:3'-5' exonuclease [Verrucomicrobiota bacterium]
VPPPGPPLPSGHVIDTPAALAALVADLELADWLALDTEADSLHAYPEKLCLIQIAHPRGEALVDPLAGLDLAPLLRVFARHELILHGGDYDLRLMHRTWGFAPAAGFFDTMNAARLVGVRQFGLNDLLHRFVGVTQEKGPQKADWGRRPLTERMVHYALNDVRHLRALSNVLREELARLGRLDWHHEVCAKIIHTATHYDPPDPDQVWRIKGCGALDRLGLAVLREEWRWREAEAVRANRPTFHIIVPDKLIELAQAASARGQVPFEHIPRHLTARRHRGLVAAIETALGLPPDERPEKPRVERPRPNLAVIARADQLKAVRDRRAAELGLDPSYLASRTQLFELAETGDPARTSLMRWQAALLARPGAPAAFDRGDGSGDNSCGAGPA